jgi:hypothetical protein
MSDSPATEQRKSRRGLLALAGAGGAAAVAALLGRSNGAKAHGTAHWDSHNSEPAVHGNNTANGPGVTGSGDVGMGVYGYSPSNAGVYGSSDNDYGVFGISNSYIGVYGYSPNSSGVWGSSASAAGVKGDSARGAGVKGKGKPGVYGICDKNHGAGVKGEGDAPGSMGLYGKNKPGRRALRTKGKVQMDCARKVTLSEMGNTITLPSSVIAASGAAVLAMVQGNPGNDALIRRAFRIDSTHIRITFNKKPANPVSVAYWVVHTG